MEKILTSINALTFNTNNINNKIKNGYYDVDKRHFINLTNKYITMNSYDLSKCFNSNYTKKWHEYNELFEKYHCRDEYNPRFKVINYLKQFKNKEISIADFGCGDAFISKYFKENDYTCEYDLFNFSNIDLCDCDNDIIKCDMKNTLFKSKQFDFVIFCMSLWGNVTQNINEALRVLNHNGKLIIVEEKDRWIYNNKNHLLSLICKTYNDSFVCVEHKTEINKKYVFHILIKHYQ